LTGFHAIAKSVNKPLHCKKKPQRGLVNSDGKTDLISFDESTTGYHVWWQQSTIDGYNESQLLFTIDTAPRMLKPLDWDNDGDIDYLVVATDGTLSWYQNLGGGIFGNPP
jgi:hypothetical protein